MIENEIENDLLKDPKEGGDIEKVIAEQAISTLVPCTLPLKDLLRVKPRVWTKMSRKLCFPELQVKVKPPGNPQNSKEPDEKELASINKMSKKKAKSDTINREYFVVRFTIFYFLQPIKRKSM